MRRHAASAPIHPYIHSVSRETVNQLKQLNPVSRETVISNFEFLIKIRKKPKEKASVFSILISILKIF